MEPKIKIKILQLVNGFAIGGAESKLLDLVKHVNRDRYEIIVCSVGQGGPLQNEFENLGIKVVMFQKKFAFDLSLVLKVKRLIQEEGIDIIQTTLLYADLIGAVAARLANVPTVISWETVSHGSFDTLRTKSRHKIAYRFAMRYVSKIVAVSDETRDFIITFRKIDPGKIQTIHYGVDLNKFQKTSSNGKRQEIGISNETPVVGVVARLEEVKGHRFLIEAAKEIINKIPDTQFVFIGDGSLRSSFEQRVEELGLTSNFKFLGFRKDVHDLLNVLDVFVLPSISEGLPNVILEAMANEKPVVATAVGGIPEAIINGETGYLVPEKNSEALQEAIIKLLENKKNANKMGRNGRKRVEEEFSLQKEIAEFEKLYDKCYKQRYFANEQNVRVGSVV
jgi:glycosyltransferase involved in cell wall biosynthesis